MRFSVAKKILTGLLGKPRSNGPSGVESATLQRKLAHGIPYVRKCRPDCQVDPDNSFRAVQITDDILTLLGSEDGWSAVVTVPKVGGEMRVHRGEYLTDAGYSITPEALFTDFKPASNVVDIRSLRTVHTEPSLPIPYRALGDPSQ